MQVLGAGAFGTALAIVMARAGHAVGLMSRDPGLALRRESLRLPGVRLPDSVAVIDAPDPLAEFTLLAVPMQAQAAFLADHGRALVRGPVISCAKGIDAATGRGATALIHDAVPGALAALMTGPGFAADIAAGLPTAMTLACINAWGAEAIQMQLSTPTLRLYRTTDVTGAELGGALKNVVAIGAGAAIGAGFGDSARAALMTRGFAEMVRLAEAEGAKPETLMGLSGFGDLVLTCTSPQSRNFRFGRALGAGATFDPAVTVEGIATARAVLPMAARRGVDAPLTAMIVALIDGRVTPGEAVEALLARPLKRE